MADAWVLGSMGWMPAAGRQTACVLVELGDELIMLDAGTGVANLAAFAGVLECHDRLSIVLSHYHLDHVSGLMYLKRFVANKQVDVYGPGRPVYPRTTESYLRDLLQTTFYSSGPTGFAQNVRFFDYGGEDFAVGEVTIHVRPQYHSASSFELRLDDVLTYATDTRFDAQDWAGYPTTKVLLHECWQLTEEDARHSSVSALVTGIPHDVFDRVALIHQNPAWDEREREQVTEVAAMRGFELATDGMHIPLE